MITKAMLQEVKQFDIGKDHELTKQRVSEIWKTMSKELKDQVFQLGITNSTVNRTRALGNISVKTAVALAVAAGADPYFLIGETEENNGADEDKIKQFLIDKGYEKVLDIKNAPEKPKRKVKKEIVEEKIIEETPVKEKVLSIQEVADIQISNLPDNEKKALFEMPEDDFNSLAETLELQSKYSEKAKNLLGLFRLILLR